jgi:hypothetical protein
MHGASRSEYVEGVPLSAHQESSGDVAKDLGPSVANVTAGLSGYTWNGRQYRNFEAPILHFIGTVTLIRERPGTQANAPLNRELAAKVP